MVEETSVVENVENSEAEQAPPPPEPIKIFTVESKMRNVHSLPLT